MKNKLFSACLALAMGAGAGYATTVFAQAKPEVLVKQRQAAMTLQGKYFYGTLRPMAQGKMPYDATAIARTAGYLHALSGMPWDGFAPGTKGVKSRALPAIWEQPDNFKAAAEKFQGDTAKLVELTRGGDEAAIKAQILEINKACGSCHDDFRGK
jgi:cytochrome c556